MIPTLLGGLGIFLLGMVLMTDGLKALAGEALRGILTRSISTPLAGVGWGALITALVQSSTATTLTTVGFVSAGLLTFPQAVGVIFGANLGTTSTGWIVSQLGFKVSFGAMSPPLVLVGVALRLLSKGRLAHAGSAIVGFALLFMGIDLLQSGMSSLASRLSPDAVPSGGPVGMLLLVGLGCLMTLVMLSSSAAMTTTLAAVASGAISLEQAAALAIGQNIGTTPKAVGAAIGASAAAKRTAVAHVLFNVLTAVIALLVLPGLLRVSAWGAGAVGAGDAPTTLALFHTVFNLLGVVLLFPFIGHLARAIERLVPDRGIPATRYLDPAVAEVGPVALEAARRALIYLLADVARMTAAMLRSGPGAPPLDLTANPASAGLRQVIAFVHRLGRADQSGREPTREQALLHAAHHLGRGLAALVRRQSGPNAAWDGRTLDPVVARAAVLVADLAARIAEAGDEGATRPAAGADPLESLAEESTGVSNRVAAIRREERREALRLVATGALDPNAAMTRIDALLWLDSIGYHLWRATHHLCRQPAPQADESDDSDSVADPDRGRHREPPNPDHAR